MSDRSDIHIREASPTDLPAIALMIRELAEYEERLDDVTWSTEELGREIFGDGAVPNVLLATLNGSEVLGMALYFSTFSTFRGKAGIWLEDLFVKSDYRGRGVGRALLESIRDRTDQRVEWNVLDWNVSAQGFYSKLGAFPMGEWTTWRWLPDGEIPER